LLNEQNLTDLDPVEVDGALLTVETVADGHASNQTEEL
jgi:hypothetical protein